MRVPAQLLGPEAVDEEDDVRRGSGQDQPGRCLADRAAERLGDGWYDVGEGPLLVGRLDEPVVVVHAPWVLADSDSANASSPPTASPPSAAAETRREKSSEAKTPV